MIDMVICEDDEILLDYMKQRLNEILQKNSIEAEVQAYNSSKELLGEIGQFQKKPSVAFLDIDIDREADGFRIAKKLRNYYGHDVTIIFLTSYSEYVFQCFDYEPLGFVRKKHFEIEFEPIVIKALEKVNKSQKQLVFFKTTEGDVKIHESEIIYFEKIGKSVKIKTISGCFEVVYQLSELQDMLDKEKFFMIYRSIVVNMDYVSRVDRDQVVLEEGTILPMSRYRAKEVRQAFQLNL